VVLDLAQVVEHRARVHVVERQQVNDGSARGGDRVAPAVRHDAVADLDRKIERAVRRVRIGEPGQRAGHGDGPFERAADRQEPPAGEAVHVLVHQTGEAADLAQQHAHRAGGVVAGGDALGHAPGGLGKIVQRRPAIDREPVADVAGADDRRVEHADQRRRHRGLGVEADRLEILGEMRAERRGGVGGFGQPHVVGAQQPHRALSALDVAAEPVEVVAGAARQHAGPDPRVGRGGGRQHADRFDPALADHPDVGGGAAALHADGARLRGPADPGEAALHHLPAARRAGEEHAQAHRPRQQPAVDVGRRGREHHRLLADQPGAVGLQPGVERLAGLGPDLAAEHGGVVSLERQPGRERRADHHPVAVGSDVGALGRLAAPPRGDVGQDQRLAEQGAGDPRHEGEQRPGLEHARAEGVDQGDRALPQRADQARGAEPRAGVELERIGEGGVQPPPEHADRSEAGDGADHDPAVLDGQVLAFEQHEAEVAGDVGVLEVGVVERAGREDGDTGVALVREALQRVAKGAEEAGEAVDVVLGVEVGVDARGRDPVLQCEAGARGRLGAVAEHPPGAVGAAADFEGNEVQVVAAARRHPDHRPQPFAAAGDQAGRQVAVGDQAVRAVEVGDQRLEQVGALDQAAGDAGGFLLLDQDRNVGQRPGALAGARGAVLAEEHAGVAQVLVAAGEASAELVGVEPRQVLDERSPDRADAACGVKKLVGDAGRRAVVRQQARDRVVGRWLPRVLLSQP